MLHWRDSSDRLTRCHKNYTRSAFDACRKHHLIQGPLAEVSTIDFWGAGQTGKPWIRWFQKTDRTIRKIYEVSPKKIGQKIHGVPVFAPDDLLFSERYPLIIAVGAAGAREQIEPFIQQRGYTLGKDAWFVA